MKSFGGAVECGAVGGGEKVIDKAMDEYWADEALHSEYVIHILVHPGKKKQPHTVKDAAVSSIVMLWGKTGGEFGVSEELMFFCSAKGCDGIPTSPFILTDEEKRSMPESSWRHPEEWPPEVYGRWRAHEAQKVFACPKCGLVQTRDMMADSLIFNCSLHDLAHGVDKIWQMTGASADLLKVVNRGAHNFNAARIAVRSGDMSGARKSLEAARDYEFVRYSHESILRDMRNGTQAHNLFHAFLRA